MRAAGVAVLMVTILLAACGAGSFPLPSVSSEDLLTCGTMGSPINAPAASAGIDLSAILTAAASDHPIPKGVTGPDDPRYQAWGLAIIGALRANTEYVRGCALSLNAIYSRISPTPTD